LNKLDFLEQFLFLEQFQVFKFHFSKKKSKLFQKLTLFGKIEIVQKIEIVFEIDQKILVKIQILIKTTEIFYSDPAFPSGFEASVDNPKSHKTKSLSFQNPSEFKFNITFDGFISR